MILNRLYLRGGSFASLRVTLGPPKAGPLEEINVIYFNAPYILISRLAT